MPQTRKLGSWKNLKTMTPKAMGKERMSMPKLTLVQPQVLIWRMQKPKMTALMTTWTTPL